MELDQKKGRKGNRGVRTVVEETSKERTGGGKRRSSGSGRTSEKGGEMEWRCHRSTRGKKRVINGRSNAISKHFTSQEISSSDKHSKKKKKGKNREKKAIIKGS